MIAATTAEGFTGHEMLDGVGLIHMNGRVYDPTMGRFLSVDPIVRDTAASQSWNGYGYVEGRMLSATDPDGFKTDVKCPSCVRPVDPTPLPDDPMFEVVVTASPWPLIMISEVPGFWANVDNLRDMPTISEQESTAERNGGAKKSEDQKPDTCPTPPAAPPGVDVKNNIDIAKDYSWLNPAADAALYQNVKNYGLWDYKRRGSQYEDFGNFNFGAVTAAMGMPYYLAQSGAGVYQQWKGAATAGSGTPLMDWPYGDANSDAKQIQLGRDYVKKGCYGVGKK